jgi:hypothetical protein
MVVEVSYVVTSAGWMIDAVAPTTRGASPLTLSVPAGSDTVRALG